MVKRSRNEIKGGNVMKDGESEKDGSRAPIYAQNFKQQLTARGLVIGALGSIVITTSSMYVALRMGSLPWPIIFVAVMSMALLRLLGNTNVNEVNVTHTAMSAGSMVAGGLAFTIPGIWIMNGDMEIGFFPLVIVTLSGTLLGLILTILIRPYFIEKENLPYPMGIAAAETVMAGNEGEKAKWLFSTLTVAAVFTIIRDWFGWIPIAWNSTKLAAHNIFFGVWISPMSIGIGYIIGPLYTAVWFLGGVISYFFLIPVGVSEGWFSDVARATAFKDSLGIGLLVGTGAGILIKGILPRAREIYGSMLPGKTKSEAGISLKWAPAVVAVLALLLTFFTEMNLISSLLTIVGCWLTTAMAASVTGQTGINPMEIFGIIVLLAIKVVSHVGMMEGFFIAAVVAVACGLAGDILNDFKSGHILKTNPRAQFISGAVGGVVGSIVAVVVLYMMHESFGKFGPGTELPAPQAFAVSSLVGGLSDPTAFYIGLLIGAVLFLLNLPGMTLGLGIYLPMFITTSVFIGGIIKFIHNKINKNHGDKGVIVASGLLGGEGVAGVLIAIIKVLIRG
jgi:putative OPT family oligopeptide transporter